MTRLTVLLALALSVGTLSTVPLRAQDAVKFPKLKTAPVIDGKLGDWEGVATVKMSEPNVDDLRVDKAAVAWDDKNLYLAARVPDRKVINAQPLDKLRQADCLELRLVAKRNVYARVLVAPTSGESKSALLLSERELAGKVENKLAGGTASPDASGAQWAAVSDDDGWTVEAAIPLSLLGIAPKAGTKLPFVLVVWDKDSEAADEWKEWARRSESSSQKAPTDKWPAAILTE